MSFFVALFCVGEMSTADHNRLDRVHLLYSIPYRFIDMASDTNL
jgi:hypothetical protein